MHFKHIFRQKESSRKKLQFEIDQPTSDEEDVDYLDAYEYQSPTQKRITDLEMQLQIKNAVIESTESGITKLLAEYGTPYDGDTLGEVCKRCHEKGRHRKPKCPNPPCISIKQCGRLDKHKDEEKILKKEKNQLKQLKKEALKLEDEIKKYEQAEQKVASSFTEAIKYPLIRSNKKKYLIEINGALHPNTKNIVRDTAFLQTYYKNKVPDNVKDKSMGKVFQNIINDYESKHIKPGSDPVLSLLKDKGVKFPEKPQKKQQSSTKKDNSLQEISETQVGEN